MVGGGCQRKTDSSCVHEEGGGIDPFRLARCRTATTNQSRLQSSTTPSKRM